MMIMIKRSKNVLKRKPSRELNNILQFYNFSLVFIMLDFGNDMYVTQNIDL